MNHNQQAEAMKILRDVLAAWRGGELGSTEAGILGAPTFIQKAAVLIEELDK